MTEKEEGEERGNLLNRRCLCLNAIICIRPQSAFKNGISINNDEIL